jgi:hypothetical protein
MRVDELGAGDQWLTPAVRWETVTGVAEPFDGSYWVQVFTDKLAEGYAWSLPRRTEVHAVSGSDLATVRTVTVRETRTHVWAELTATRDWYFRDHDRGAVSLVNAHQLGQGQGWQILNHPDGGALVSTTAQSKTAARSAVKRAARHHAKALNVPFRLSGAAS